MDIVDLIGLLPLVTYVAFAVAEWRWPARSFPPRRGWHWIGAAFLVLMATLGTAVPLVLPIEWMAAHRWWDGAALGVAGGTLVGFVVLELVIYAWHRAAHHVDFLWRGFHQVHHAPRRVDIPGSVVFHPFEMLVQVTLQLFVTVIVLGLHPVAAALTGYLIAFNSMFQHWNVRTPTWVGYIIQRPEAHCVHHRLGLHYYNFADLSVVDMLFGTFRNPRQFLGECGFDGGADARLPAMLRFTDVNRPLYGAGSRGVKPAKPPGALAT